MAEQPDLKQAFDDLLDSIGRTVKQQFDQLESQVKERRLATLASDLEELNKRQASSPK